MRQSISFNIFYKKLLVLLFFISGLKLCESKGLVIKSKRNFGEYSCEVLPSSNYFNSKKKLKKRQQTHQSICVYIDTCVHGPPLYE